MTRIMSFGNPPPEIRRAAAQTKKLHDRGWLHVRHIRWGDFLTIRVNSCWILFSDNQGKSWGLATRERVAKECRERRAAARQAR